MTQWLGEQFGLVGNKIRSTWPVPFCGEEFTWKTKKKFALNVLSGKPLNGHAAAHLAAVLWRSGLGLAQSILAQVLQDLD